jgi:integrase
MRDGSGSRHYRYVIEQKRKDRWDIYFQRRKGDPRIRLRERPGTPEFDAEYQRVFAGVPAEAKAIGRRWAGHGTFAWLVEQYLLSTAFTLKLDVDSTQRARRRVLDSICRETKNGREFGTLPIAAIRPRDIAWIRDRKAETPTAGNNRVKVLRTLFGWACLPEVALAKENPAKVTFLETGNREGHKTWTEEQAQLFEARHPLGTKSRLCFDLLAYTGARISDIARFGPGMIKNGMLHWTEHKGRRRKAKHHQTSILPGLQASIDAFYAAGNLRHMVFLTTRIGEQLSDAAASSWFSAQCRAAGIEPGFTAHGIRKYVAVRLIDMGYTEAQVMAVCGWETAGQIRVYIERRNRRLLEQGTIAGLARGGTPDEQNSYHFSASQSPVITFGRKAQ